MLRKFVRKDGDYVIFKYNCGDFEYMCLIPEWDLYLLKEELITKYNVPLELIKKMESLYFTITKEFID